MPLVPRYVSVAAHVFCTDGHTSTHQRYHGCGDWGFVTIVPFHAFGAEVEGATRVPLSIPPVAWDHAPIADGARAFAPTRHYRGSASVALALRAPYMAPSAKLCAPLDLGGNGDGCSLVFLPYHGLT